MSQKGRNQNRTPESRCFGHKQPKKTKKSEKILPWGVAHEKMKISVILDPNRRFWAIFGGQKIFFTSEMDSAEFFRNFRILHLILACQEPYFSKNGLYLPKFRQNRFKIAQIIENRVPYVLESNVVHENLGKIQLSPFPT